MEDNIRRVQAHLARHGIGNRPHVKTHKIPAIGKMQMAAGAMGITCQKLGEVEVFVDAGVADDILLTYNILGRAKTDRLVALIRRAPGLTVVLDNDVVAKELSEAGVRHGVDVRFVVDCDTGFGRTGVQTPEAALELARLAARLPRMQFRGLMTFPNREPTTREFFERALALFDRAGMAVPVVSGGGTPTLFTAQNIPMLTEHRAGTCVFNDAMVVASGTATWDNCAMRVRATVVSRPTDGRAVLDCGTKVLTSDQYGMKGYGHVMEYPEAVVANLSEEHGVVDLSACARAAEGRRRRPRRAQSLLRGEQHGGRALRRARRSGRGDLAGRGPGPRAPDRGFRLARPTSRGRRRQEVPEQQHVEVDEQELVPRRRGVERLARVGELRLEDSGQGRLGEAHRADHQVRRDLAAGAVLAMAVGERHAEQVVRDALARDHLPSPEPPREAVLAALDAIAVGRPVLAQEEPGALGEREEMVVEGRGQRRAAGQHERRRFPDQRDVLVAEADEGHLIPHESIHVGARMYAAGLAHGGSA